MVSMRFKSHFILLAAVVGTSFSMQVLADGPMHSPDQVPGKTPSSVTRDVHNADADGLGTQLPANFDKDKVIEQVAKGKNPDLIVLAGVVPWPQMPGRYIAIACQALNDEQLKYQRSSGAPKECDSGTRGGDNNFDEIFLGIYEMGKDGKPVLLARNHDYINDDVSWDNTNLQAPDLPESDASSNGGQGAGNEGLTPQVIKKFDLAPYEIRKGQYAFGLRVGWNTSYAGGGADYEALLLFQQVGDDIQLIFAQPMMAYTNIAGDWHQDGMRDHDITDDSNVLVMLDSQTHGYRDIELRERKGAWRKVFVWSLEDGAYVAR
jgi:hypothetical protein